MTTHVQQIELPNGYWVNGVHYQRAELRALTGADEEFLGEASTEMLPVTRSTQLLTRCLLHLDGTEIISSNTVEALSIGDREALLLHLRRLTFGDHVQAVLHCPSPECREPMDLTLRIRDLLQPPQQDLQPEYDCTIHDDNQSVHIRFRLPTVLDQELASHMARVNLREATDLFYQRCVTSVSNENGEPIPSSPPVLEHCSRQILELDPQSEMNLKLSCPACDQTFSTVFDPGHFIFQETGMNLDRLYDEVHYLASHYHWSESEILGMNTSKRRRYLKRLLETHSLN